MALGIVIKLMYHARDDFGIVLCTCAGVTMSCLIATRGLTSGYVTEAEKINYDFLTVGDDLAAGDAEIEPDTVIVATFGSDIIGALVLRLEHPPSPSRKKTPKNGSGGRGVIRAWTTGLRYRGKGIGTGLLEEAIRVTRATVGRDAEVVFAGSQAEATANGKRVLPSMFNGALVKGEERARRCLEKVVRESRAGEERRRRGSR